MLVADLQQFGLSSFEPTRQLVERIMNLLFGLLPLATNILSKLFHPALQQFVLLQPLTEFELLDRNLLTS